MGDVVADGFLHLRPEDPTEIATYVLRARLGSGGMGNVYLSFSPGGYPLAIKIVKQVFADDPEFRRRFRREITAAQQVQGYYTAPVRDAGPDDEIPWFATAYIAGPSLQTAVAEHGPFPVFSVFRLLAGASEGISAVHAAGLIHRDLKPANVLLADDGPRVIDFGIAHAASSSTLTGTGVAIGTPAYMAPEQVRGKVTKATDVFALGHLGLFAATGHSAFGEGNPDALFYRVLNEPPDLEGCPDELRDIVARCLAKDPADRPEVSEVTAFASAAMRGQTMRLVGGAWLPLPVAQTLSDYSASRAPLPEPSTQTAIPAAVPAAVPAAPLRRRRRPAFAIPAALILIVAAALGFLALPSHKSNGATPDPKTATGAARPTISTAPPARAISPTVSPSVRSATASARPQTSTPFTPGSDQLPQQLSGTWRGTAFQASAAETYPVVLQLATQPGTTIGTSDYETLGCHGELRLNAVFAYSVEITEYITSNNGNCVSPVQITLKWLDKNHIFYSFSNPGYPDDGQATLTRS